MDAFFEYWTSTLVFLTDLGGPKSFILGVSAATLLIGMTSLLRASTPKRLRTERTAKAKAAPYGDQGREQASEDAHVAVGYPKPAAAAAKDGDWRRPIVDGPPPDEPMFEGPTEDYRQWREERSAANNGGADGLLDDLEEAKIAAAPLEDMSDLDFNGATQAAPRVSQDEEPNATMAAAPPADPIACTVFAPEAVQSGEDVLIQAMIHPESEAVQAALMAQAADPGAERRVAKAFAEALAPGHTVTVSLEIPGAEIDPARQSLRWRGKTAALQFAVRFKEARATGSTLAKLRIYVDDLPVASALWRMEVQSKPVDEQLTASIRAHRYGRAFISYASEDREEVLKRVQSLNALGVEVFVDLLSLDPGDRWEAKLYENIDEADAFFLFWSQHSAGSEWVEKEWRYALNRANRTDDEAPDIRPIILEAPPPPPPPELSAFHFNDASAYVIAALERVADTQ